MERKLAQQHECLGLPPKEVRAALLKIPAAAAVLQRVNRYFLRKIRQEIHCSHWKYHSDEALSIQYKYDMEQVLQESSDINMTFLAKPIMTEERCNIVFADNDMLQWAKRFMGNRTLLLDTTFGLNRQGYALLTALVVDEHGCGLPVMYAILKNESEEEFTHALNAFKLAVNDGVPDSSIMPATVMTDFSKAEKNALRCGPDHENLNFNHSLDFKVSLSLFEQHALSATSGWCSRMQSKVFAFSTCARRGLRN